MTKTLIQRLIEVGYPREDMGHHASDLYIYDTPETRAVLKEYCKNNGWHNQLQKKI